MKQLPGYKWLYAGLLFAGLQTQTFAQDNAGYQTPPSEITDVILAKGSPGVLFSDDGNWMIFLERDAFPSVAELALPELRIAGLRITPTNFTTSRNRYINKVWIKNVKTNQEITLKGIPANALIDNMGFNPGQNKISFTVTNETASDLYTAPLSTGVATKVNKTRLNLIMNSYSWLNDNTILYYGIVKPATAAPKAPSAPTGPTIQESYGSQAPARTYQDMIKSAYDEQLFEFYSTTQLIKNTGGVETPMNKPAIYSSVRKSPDKQYLLVRTIQKPFSYIVPASGFPSSTFITDLNGKVLKTLANNPSTEQTPSGRDNIQNVPRGFGWRSDEPNTITWAVALDSGLIKNKVEYRDEVLTIKAPFTAAPASLVKTKMRYRGISWGDAKFAILSEGLASKQTNVTNIYNPSTGEVKELFTRSTTDAYSNPGSPVTVRNQYNIDVIKTFNNGQSILLQNNVGSSPKGDYPFLVSLDLNSKKIDTLWKCQEGYYETITNIVDPENLTLITRKESTTEVPNYWLKNLKKRIADIQLTNFKNPYPQLEGVSKEKIKYKRADGIDLTGDLYLPKGYDAKKDGPLPVIMWAYPREYNSASDAAQVRGSEHRFTLLSYGSPIAYVTQGYAVFNNAEMPIVAKNDSLKPNDNFIEQLHLNAEAAVKVLSDKGVGDKNRMAVGGHSYGAFMTAHLLAHTNLFKAGIARSGAYNRTLTPFGFQNEDRTYWQAPNLYYDMSPFSYANKIKTPLLLIHGDADNNTGTFPMQSDRFFNAIKGHGGNSRFVLLPYESHGYAAKENILHMLWEQYQWLEKYVKNAK